MAESIPAPAPARSAGWRDMSTAPKDGTLVRLLVDFEHHATEDGDGPQPTIGANTYDNHHDFDEWQFAGWNWEQDCYTQGVGTPIGWLPMVDEAALAAIPMVDIVPPATSRDRWMYQQGWLAALDPRSHPQSTPAANFQARVQPWLLACFGELIAGDREERNHRHLEEALELVQACGCTAGEAHELVEYVFQRPVGNPSQEVGGVMVTLAALCLANGLDMHSAAEAELARIWTKVEQIRAKQASKPKHSPLPGAAS